MTNKIKNQNLQLFKLIRLFICLFLITCFSSCLTLVSHKAKVMVSLNKPAKIYVFNYKSNEFEPVRVKDSGTLSNKSDSVYYVIKVKKQLGALKKKGTQYKEAVDLAIKNVPREQRRISTGFDSIVKTNKFQFLTLKIVPLNEDNYQTVYYSNRGFEMGNGKGLLYFFGNLPTLLFPGMMVDLFTGSTWNYPKAINLSMNMHPIEYRRARAKEREQKRRDSLLVIAKENKIKVGGDKYYCLSGNEKNGWLHGDGSALSADTKYLITAGSFENGKLAKGTMCDINSNNFTGHFRNFSPAGKGIMTDFEGTIFEGEFSGWKLQSGTIKFIDGSKYAGGIKDGEMHGPGKLTLPDGGYYVGSFVKGKPEGKGELVKENEKFIGTFKNGVPHGKGVYIENGIAESSEWFEGQRIDQAYLLKKENMRSELARQHELKAERDRQAAIAREMGAWEDSQKTNRFLKGLAIVVGVFIGATILSDISNNQAIGSTLTNGIERLSNSGNKLSGNSGGNDNLSKEDLAKKNKGMAEKCTKCAEVIKYKNKINAGYGCQTCANCAALAYYWCLYNNKLCTMNELSVYINAVKQDEQIYGVETAQCHELLSGACK